MHLNHADPEAERNESRAYIAAAVERELAGLSADELAFMADVALQHAERRLAEALAYVGEINRRMRGDAHAAVSRLDSAKRVVGSVRYGLRAQGVK